MKLGLRRQLVDVGPDPLGHLRRRAQHAGDIVPEHAPRLRRAGRGHDRTVEAVDVDRHPHLLAAQGRDDVLEIPLRLVLGPMDVDPVRNVTRGGILTDFSFYGPTCDSADKMEGPFSLPEDTQAGDYIEIGQLGAYGRCMATRFNGYGDYAEAACTDDPFGSVFIQDNEQIWEAIQ